MPHHVLVIGGATIDIKGRAQAPIQPNTSTPGDIRLSVGGVGRNIAENLARLEVPTVLLSAVGDDAFGRQILERTRAGGVDVQWVICSADHHSSTYLALLDETGVMVVAIADMAVMELLTPRFLYQRRGLFKDALLLVLDGSLSEAALATALNQAERYGVPVCVDPTSRFIAHRFCPHLRRLKLITPNIPEAEVICGLRIRGRDDALHAAQCLVGSGVEIAIVTLGPEGLVYASRGESGWVPAIEPDVVDFTGAGDALTAAVVFGLLNEVPLDEAVRLGVAAATLTIQSPHTVRPDLSQELLYDQLVL